MSTRAEIEQVPAGLRWLLDLRYRADNHGLDDLTDDELGQAFRWLTAARYSAGEGAKKISALLAARPQQGEGTDDGDHGDDHRRDAGEARHADACLGRRGR